MARIRTIKPEFFTSEDIVSLSPLARLLYIAIWCEADREGRLAWKPMTFKLRYLPADNCDARALCQELLDSGLVVLYGDGLAFIPAFTAHQHINPRESESRFPSPDECDATRCEQVNAPRDDDAQRRVNDASARDSDAQGGRERKGKEGKGKEGIYHPNGWLSEAAETAASGPDPTESETPQPKPPGLPDCPYQRILGLWGKRLPHLTQPRVWEGSRRKNMRARWQQAAKPSDFSPEGYASEEAGLAWWDSFFAYIASETTLAEGFSSNGRTWRPDLEWVCNAANFQKIIDGKYDK